MITDYQRLSGVQKVAILFSILGESLAITSILVLSVKNFKVLTQMNPGGPLSF